MNRRQILKSILLAPFVGLIKSARCQPKSASVRRRITVRELDTVQSMYFGGATHQMYVEFDWKGKIYCSAQYYDSRRVSRKQIDRVVDKAIERTIKRVA